MSDEPEPERVRRWALGYLGRYASSRSNLVRVLRRRASRAGHRLDATSLTGLLDDLTRLGLLDDRGFAARRAGSMQTAGRSAVSLTASLLRKGVGRADIDRALTGYDELAAAVAFARRRRLGPYRVGEPDRYGEVTTMRRAGFSAAVTRRVVAAEAIDALADDAGD